MACRPRLAFVPALAVVLCAVAAVANDPARDAVDPAALMVAAARRALDDRRPAEAVEHLLRAWTIRPGSDDLAALLLRACAADPDARTLWIQEWFDYHAGAAARPGPAPELRTLLDKQRTARTAAAATAAARAQAVAALVKFAREREAAGRTSLADLIVAWWARRAAADLAAVSPALVRSLPEAFDRQVTVPAGFWLPVLAALKESMDAALGRGRAEEAIRAARILRGLAVQAGFKDLQGEKPQGVERFGAAAAAGLERARGLRADQPEVAWTVEGLRALDADQVDAFTREHADFSRPGVAVSPGGRYRIETDCGRDTLLGVAATVEAHHRRLVGWFGEDPFVGTQGLVRVVPEAVGLEAEGAPFWWVGGFQGGDSTTVRFSCGRIEDLGHVITHELTHRFDFALFPGCPAWLMEGRAVWTQAAYAHSSETKFVANHAVFGTIEDAWRRGYGGREALAKLLEGTIADYRDNYVAGYALYVYLDTWEEGGRKLYSERLRAYLRGGARGGAGAVRSFERHFADGAEGRPSRLEGFAAAFDQYIAGFYWMKRAEFTTRYTAAVPNRPADPWVYDEPTWVWSRARSEPTFGEGQAALAGSFLEEEGKSEAAVRAWVWALMADGATPQSASRLAALLEATGKADAAWVLRRHAGFPYRPAAGPAPFARALPDAWAFAARLRDDAARARAAAQPCAAAVFAAEHDRVAAWLGEPFLDPILPGDATLLHPVQRPARLMTLAGWVEDGLTDYERHRVKNLWYATEAGDLHVGREQPRSASGTMDRSAAERHAFVRSTDWQMPGAWRVRMRVNFTTTYVSGAVILGYGRRDRNLRFGFRGGDYMYSIGKADEATKIESIAWSLGGLRTRDGGLSGAAPDGSHKFGREASGFNLELIVDGATVVAAIDGTTVGEYHTVDGAPIEGFVGFASSLGAYAVLQPVVERLDRCRVTGRSVAPRPGLDFAHHGKVAFERQLARACEQLPAEPTGTLLFWLGTASEEGAAAGAGAGKGAGGFDAEAFSQQAKAFIGVVVERVTLAGVTQPVAFALPAAAGKERIAALLDERRQALECPLAWVTYGEGPAPAPAAAAGAAKRELGRLWCVFVDAAGTPRVRNAWTPAGGEFSGEMWHWLRVFREHGRPARRPPETEKPGAGGGGGG